MRWITRLVLLFLALNVAAPIRAQSPCNFSTRMDLSPGGTSIVGFVVPGTTPAALLIRAVGPSLKSFGISNPVSAPHMQLFNSRGLQFAIGYAVPISTGYVDFGPVFASAGAFPLTGGELPFTAYNYGSFQPGAYTVMITDDSGKGGTVLFEVYVLSGAVAATAPTTFIMLLSGPPS